MILHNICLCSYTFVNSGGGKFTFEIIPKWGWNYKNINYFGYNHLDKEWNLQNNNLETINLFKSEKNFKKFFPKFSILLLYFLIFFKSLKFIRKFTTKGNIIISHSDAWPDTLFAFLLKLRNKNAYWIAINHMILPSPWKGYKYIYTNKIKLPSLIDLYQWLNQRIFFLLQKKANLLVSINNNDKKYLLSKNKNVLIVRCGREYTGSPNFNLESKIYDICFLGRFYEQKGIDEIPDILANLNKICDKRLSIIFIGGENNYSEKLKKKLESQKLNFDIKFLGPKYGQDKYNFLKKTKVMFLPSYFESFGIVYLDAINVGTPVIEYDLPCFCDHKFGVIKVPFKDNIAFAKSLKKMLTDDNLYKKLAKEGYEYSKEFSWDKTAREFENVFESIS